jgi:hypothetical protein
MKSRLSRLLALASATALITTACSVDPEQASQAAERVMTVAAQITPGAVETVIASSPLGTAMPAAPAEAPLVYARCITRGETALLETPEQGATEMVTLNSRTIITAYGRTPDGAWVLGWNADDVNGWLPASIIGCTAPVEDLRATAAGLLLTPTAVVAALSTEEVTPEATLEPAGVFTNEVTLTPESTLETTATASPEATATELPIATETAQPTEMPLPATETSEPAAFPTATERVTRTPAPTRMASTATALPATTNPAAPARVITVVVTATPPRSTVLVPLPEDRGSGESQVRDLRCIVTPGTPVNLRGGPARTERLLGTLPAGTRFLAQGRNEDASWLYGFTERQMPGWLIASSVECDGNATQLVEVDR